MPDGSETGRDLSRVARGRWGEDLAARHYRRAGYAIIDRNWRCAHGEIDLVVRRGRLVVFCEVKTRRTAAYGGAVAAVDPRKQRRIRRLAAMWLAVHRDDPALGGGDPGDPGGTGGMRGIDVRFDVAAITGVRLDVIESAF